MSGGLAPFRMPLPISMNGGVRVDLSQGSAMRGYLQMNGPIVRALRPDHFARVIKEALYLGAEYWRCHWMPLRFTPQSPVIVANTPKWQRIKLWRARRQLPQFVGLTPLRGGGPDTPWYGRNKAKMIVNVFKTAKSKVHTKGPNRGAAVVSMSYGHGIRPEKAYAFKTIAPIEWNAMQQLMVDYIAEQFGGAESYTKRKAGLLSGNANKAMKNATGIDYNKARRSTRSIGLKLGKSSRDIRGAYMARAISSRIGGGV